MGIQLASESSAFVAEWDHGPETGLQVAIKDCLDIAGMRTRCGCEALAEAPPAGDHASVVRNLLDSGCRIVGKTRMHELAYGMTGVNHFEGTPVNPRWPTRIPGGSSSGSAVAVAAGLVDFAVGTDTGGSVRQPAICCGVVGFKPTFGRIDRTGATPAQSTLDCIGPFARSVAMIEQAMAAMDPTFARHEGEEAFRTGILRPDARVEQGMGEAVDALAATLEFSEDIEIPTLDDAFRAGMILIGRETAAAFGHFLDRDAPLGTDVKARLAAARAMDAGEPEWAEIIRSRFTAEIDALLERFDVLVTPALPLLPPLLAEAGDPAKVLSLTRYLRPFNLSGHPAIVLPATTGSGLPAGVQIVGRKGDDARLVAAARRIAVSTSIFETKE
ncbi:amidase [Rhizobium sp. ACO-34A]|nr:amidase [Rhizobium sp. ACO-34A]ATN32290.1 amidase [Rhizobium sp. ACO-34A]